MNVILKCGPCDGEISVEHENCGSIRRRVENPFPRYVNSTAKDEEGRNYIQVRSPHSATIVQTEARELGVGGEMTPGDGFPWQRFDGPFKAMSV